MTQSNSPMLVSLVDPLAANVATCGGKSAGLHKLSAAKMPVPPGFVVTTAAFDQFVGEDDTFRRALNELASCTDAIALREAALRVRNAVLDCKLSEAFAKEVIQAWETTTGNAPVAVRSSATAEDLANASFAGQQDSYLGIETQRELIDALQRCWASLFNERAVTYRRTHGFDNQHVSIAVVVQQMVQADCAGVLFTADPISGRRAISVVEAVPGLGESLVSGHATPERYRIRGRDGVILERNDTRGKAMATNAGLVNDDALRELNALGRRAETNAHNPLDIEWAIHKNKVWLLQARPITTLWPLPEGKPLPGLRTFVSFGHIQVYTAPMTRVGISVFRRIFPLRRDPDTGLSDLVHNAGERVYVDITPALGHAVFRKVLPIALSNASEPIAERIKIAATRAEIQQLPSEERANLSVVLPVLFRLFARGARNAFADPRRLGEEYVRDFDEIVRKLDERLDKTQSLKNKFEVLDDKLETLLGELMSRVIPCMLPGLVISKVMPKLATWLDPGADHRLLLQGLEGNITTEMDLALADLADFVRDVPQLVSALNAPDPVGRLQELRNDVACRDFFAAWDTFVEKNGHRGAGEIDPGIPRWREDPRIPLRSIAGSVQRPKGALREQHRTWTKRGEETRAKLVAAAQDKPLGSLLAKVMDGLIDRMRTLLALREHHKYYLILIFDRLRSIVLEAATVLENAGALQSKDDVWLLEFHEIRNALETLEEGRRPSLRALVDERRTLREKYAHMTPPSVLTSEGEAIAFVDKRDLPKNSLAGTSASGGTYDGTARVVRDPATESLGAGEILVAQFTDPGWTPLFGHAGALVMEVGGQMTHGSVIAREIGIPAVVAVEGATKRIKSGDRIRVDGERGFVTILEGGA